MNSKTSGNTQKAQELIHVQGEGPNWILIAGGALLSTLSIRIGCRIKQAFDAKRTNHAHSGLKGNGKRAPQRRSGTCESHSNIVCYAQAEEGCHHCLSGNLSGTTKMKYTPNSPMSKDGDHALPLVKIPTAESNKVNSGVMWASSPDLLELSRKPFHRSNSSDSPCFSESGSDIYSKRDVIQKLRQQLKSRDEMIMEMQAQITNLQNSLTAQVDHSVHLQSRLDSTNQDLFDSEREIQLLRKAIADHCVAEAISPERPAVTTRNWQPEAMNGKVNGYPDSTDGVELHHVGLEKVRDGERVEMFKQEVGELKEVVEGKEFLLQSYKEQKVELSAKVKELQQRLSSQVPNIL
ncbi:uncharacterized protein M6B38_102125 [Iris pallida]|uniref:Uncharacterized protein n=1 Tax=Iris pallida TaxID=29817 RepID=A0AAX6HRA8_IRIPA|nr:uncharacterized protein M6B38_300150 [Iris pallida]KAJ6854256.1 uncharacterized protein M6B38_102125 [Iris pallida]